MGNLPALLPNATPLVADFTVNCQKTVNFKATVLMLTLKKSFRFRQSLRTFPVIVSNNDSRISGKMRFAVVDKAFIINELINNRFFSELIILKNIKFDPSCH
jgi:hypothetical protein